jgi:hypothetical protein
MAAGAALSAAIPFRVSAKKGAAPLDRGVAPHTGRPRGETIADIVTKLHKTGGGANSTHSRRARGVVLA